RGERRTPPPGTLRRRRRPPDGHGGGHRRRGLPSGGGEHRHRMGVRRHQLPGLRRRSGPAHRAGAARRMTGARPRRPPLIAIDGPAGSGKSTVSRALADRLGLDRLDTGAMYRAVAWAAIRHGMATDDGGALSVLAARLRITVGDRVDVDGTDVTEAIRGPAVNRAVSAVAARPEV